MQVSPSSGEDETETMFPTANDPPTPTLTQQNLHDFNTELSPPTSQEVPSSADKGTRQTDAMDYSVGQRNGADGAKDAPSPTRDAARRMDQRNEPGASWNNLRAQEEYARAMENVVDQGFNLRKWSCEPSSNRY